MISSENDIGIVEIIKENNMMEFKKTAADMLEYYKTEVFGKMGIEIEGLQNKDAA